MGADASPLARLRRALDVGSLVQADAAARELQHLDDEDALRFYKRWGIVPSHIRCLGRTLPAGGGR
jgi:hypothetical protein